MQNAKKKLLTLLASLVLVSMLGLTACGGSASSSDSSQGESEATSTTETASSPEEDSSQEGQSGDQEKSAKLFGKPWVTSQVTGNLPAVKPEAKDDLYTNANYDYISEHQGEEVARIVSTNGELKEATLATIKDTSRTNHELEQLRIFFNQVCDQETLAKIGFSEVQPYIDMIDKVSSIDELNALLASEDFPFTPFVNPILYVVDMHGENVVAVCPNFIIADGVSQGGTYYQGTEAADAYLEVMFASKMGDASLIMGPDFDPIELKETIIGFEKSYGKFADCSDVYLNADYGTYAKAVEESVFTLDELCALCPNMPMKEMLVKCKKDGASAYSAISSGWIEALNDLWTEDNLDTIKLITKFKVLVETSPYRDKSVANETTELDASMLPDQESNAFTACNSIDTFAQVIAKEYVDGILGQQGEERLQNLTADLIDAYKELVADSSWLNDESKKLLTQKLEHMTANVLEPTSGYFDYDALELTPTEEGGTLFSNYLKLKQYRYDREAERIGKPATGDWVWFALSPTTANAFYDPPSNSINILPGFITSAVYTNDMSDAEALVFAGWTIAHEISHGFDYMGSQTDAYGLPKAVFTGDSLQKYLDKTKALADYYSTVEYMDGKYVNGQLVVGEGAADLSGLQACLVLANKAGNTDYEQFFTQAASNWAQVLPNATSLEVNSAADTHPIMNLRANVNAQMFEQFYKTFGVVEGDGMYLAPESRIVMWGKDA